MDKESQCLTPLWTSLPVASKACGELISCGCKAAVGCEGRCACNALETDIIVLYCIVLYVALVTHPYIVVKENESGVRRKCHCYIQYAALNKCVLGLDLNA
jgi:hypothetical protein